MSAQERIAEVVLDPASIIHRTPEIEHERRVAVADLVEENRFAPKEFACGPYGLFVTSVENRLLFDIRAEALTEPYNLTLAISPFRSIIRDYFVICDSYVEAIKHGSPHRIEALDMGRRATHNEGSELLQTLLEPKVSVDFDTARRLFTLICVLHLK